MTRPARGPRQRRSSIQLKIVGTMCVVVVLVTLSLTVLATHRLQTHLAAQFESKAEALALSMAFALEMNSSHAGGESSRAVKELVEASRTIEGVAYVYVQDFEGSILVHTFRPTFPPNFEEANWVEQGELTGGRRVKIASSIFIDTGAGLIEAIDVAAPIGGGRFGVVHVGMDRAEIQLRVARLRRSMMAGGGFIALLGLLLGALVVRRSVVRPIQALHRTTTEIVRTNDLSRRVDIKSEDEVGELVAALNQMLDALERSRLDQQTTNRSLAETVAKVAAANAALVVAEEAKADYAQALIAFGGAATVEALLGRSLRALSDFAIADLGVLWMVDDGGRLVPSASIGLRSSDLTPLEVGEGLAGRAAADRAITHSAAPAGWQLETCAGAIAPREIFAFPIQVRERLLGVLELGRARGPLSAERRRLLGELVGQFAVALSNLLAADRTRVLAESLEVRNSLLQEQSGALEDKQRELDEKNRELERTSKVKSQFLANMSHELRTPMNSIIGYTDLVLLRAGDGLEPRHRRNLEKVLSNGAHLLTLINNVLDLSKVEAGRMELHLEDVNLPLLLENAAATTEVLLKDRPVHLRRDFSADIPVVRADRTKLRQIVLNLLSNACKFTDRGEVRLSCTAKSEHGDGLPRALVALSVQDSGIGISEQDLEIIFDEFRQAGGSGNRAQQGTGLGLPLVKGLVQLMGGEITVQSRSGEGSTFTVMLPLEAVPSAAPRPAVADVSSGADAPPVSSPRRAAISAGGFAES